MNEQQLFLEALKHPAQDRTFWLDEACRDEQMRRRVAVLLAAHERAAGFLDAPAAAPLATVEAEPLQNGSGGMIGPYKLREQIGEGGFGVVFVAEQEKPVRRKVALKIIKPGMDTKDVIARFEAERQALALMDHPNVAHVLDAGSTEAGRPYFVMELVQGVAITEFCDKNKLRTEERLSLFVDVCRAVQHAHQKGIIHRDLKPSNVMVTLHDGKPVAKVIDFGVSKALSQQLTEKSIYTAYGQMVGTPAYMSPEQAEMSGLGIDTRSDIYSLGVLLYELLTGKTPLDSLRLRASAYAEMLRMIREEEPPRPSLKVSTLGDEATVIAQHRRTDPGELRRALAGELDWIVMKCLEKDRNRRYETANALAVDVERFLRDEAVEACPPSHWYRLSKLVRRRRAWFATAGVFLTLLLAGAAACLALAVWAKREQRVAEKARAEALAALKSEQSARQAATKAMREAVAARRTAEGFSRRLGVATQLANDGMSHTYRGDWSAAHEAFAGAEQVEKDLRTIYEGRSMLYTTLGLWDRALADYDRRYQLARRSSAQGFYEHAVLKLRGDDDPGYRALCREYASQFAASNTQAPYYYRIKLYSLSPRPFGDPAKTAADGEQLITSTYNHWNLTACGVAHLRARNLEQAVNRLREALVVGDESRQGAHRLAYGPLAIALFELDRKQEAGEALSALEEAIDEWTQQMLDNGPGTIPIDWFVWLECQQFYREARTRVAGSPPPEDPRLAAIHERALAIIEFGDGGRRMQRVREQVAQRQWDSAAEEFLKVLDTLPGGYRASAAPMRMCLEVVAEPELFSRLVTIRPQERRLWHARARLHAASGEWGQAGHDYEKTKTAIGDDPAVIWWSTAAMDWGAVMLLQQDVAGYLELRDKVLRRSDRLTVPFTANLCSRMCTLAPLESDDAATALRLAQPAVDREPYVAWFRFALGAAHYRAGNFDQAVQHLEQSLQSHPTWEGRGQNHIVLSMACRRLGRREEADAWLKKARDRSDEMNREVLDNPSGWAGSDYLTDWLAARVLLVEAEQMAAAEKGPQL